MRGILGCLVGLMVAVAGSAPALATYSYDEETYTSDQASTVTTQSNITRLATTRTLQIIQRRIAKANKGGPGASAPGALQGATFEFDAGRTGDAAGDGISGLGVWTSFNYTAYKDSTSSTEQSGDIYTGVLGADYAIADDLLVGVALTFDGVGIDTDYNLGSQSSFGAGVAPYVAYNINDFISVNATVGYAHTFGDTRRLAGAVSTGNEITGEYDADRAFVAVQGDAYYDIGNISLVGSTGAVYARERLHGYSESDGTAVEGETTELGSANVGGQVGYFFELSGDLFLQPYLSYRYDYDFAITKIEVTGNNIEDHPNDRDAHSVGAGVNMFLGDNISGGLDFVTELGRDNGRTFSGTASLRMQF